MSGGHWQYAGFKLQSDLEMLAADISVRKRWPALAMLLGALGEALYRLEHEMDWDLSGDSSIDDDADFEARAVWALLEPAMKAAPDALFPRGKWATIQAVQSRRASREPAP